MRLNWTVQKSFTGARGGILRVPSYLISADVGFIGPQLRSKYT